MTGAEEMKIKQAGVDQVERICALSALIFHEGSMEQQDEDKHGLQEWKRRLNEHNGCMFYVVDENNQILGFVFVHDHATLLKTTHIWIAGTLPSARRKGVMKSLFEHCHTVYANQDRITVNTFPSRFPNMPHFLASINYKLTSIQGDKHLYQKQL